MQTSILCVLYSTPLQEMLSQSKKIEYDEEEGMFGGPAVTLGRCRGSLLECSCLLAQLLLCLQDWVLKLGFLVDVAATLKEDTSMKRLCGYCDFDVDKTFQTSLLNTVSRVSEL